MPASVDSVRLTAAVLPDGDARVRVTYTLAGGHGGDSVPATLLAFGETAPADVSVVTPGEQPSPAPMSRDDSGRGYHVLLPLTPDDGGGASVTVTYAVASAVARDGTALRVHVPVLSLDRRPGASGPGFFQARLTVPAAWSVSETFPTGMTTALAGDSAVYLADLPVVPATLSLRAHEDDAWHPGLPLLLDLLTLVVVAGFAVVGWRHLRVEAA